MLYRGHFGRCGLTQSDAVRFAFNTPFAMSREIREVREFREGGQLLKNKTPLNT